MRGCGGLNTIYDPDWVPSIARVAVFRLSGMGMAFGEAAGRSGRWGSRGSPACSCHLPRRGGVSGIPEAAVTTSGGSTRWLQRTLASPFRGWSSWRRSAFSRDREFAPGFDFRSVSFLVPQCLLSTTAAGPATPGSLNPADDFRAPPVSNDAIMRGHGPPESRSGCRWYGSCPPLSGGAR